LEEVNEKLFKLYKEMDSKKLESALVLADFNAQLFGMVTGEEK